MKHPTRQCDIPSCAPERECVKERGNECASRQNVGSVCSCPAQETLQPGHGSASEVPLSDKRGRLKRAKNQKHKVMHTSNENVSLPQAWKKS